MSIVVVISDLHVGSTTAIAPPTFSIHVRERAETQQVEANRLQRWLYECWQDFWQYVFSTAKERKEPVHLFMLGDTIDGNLTRHAQTIPEVEDQISIAVELLEPIVHRCASLTGIIGTAFHSGDSGGNEVRIYQQLGAEGYGQHLLRRVDGKLHDLAHHGRSGQREWTSQAASMATTMALDYVHNGLNPPDYVWRGHNHLIDDSGAKLMGTRAIACPSWELRTEYGWHKGQTRSDIGGFLVIDGLLDDSHCRYKGSPDNVEVVSLD